MSRYVISPLHPLTARTVCPVGRQKPKHFNLYLANPADFSGLEYILRHYEYP
jgi:hypothetical protein